MKAITFAKTSGHQPNIGTIGKIFNFMPASGGYKKFAWSL
jgi:hypothetical protein